MEAGAEAERGEGVRWRKREKNQTVKRKRNNVDGKEREAEEENGRKDLQTTKNQNWGRYQVSGKDLGKCKNKRFALLNFTAGEDERKLRKKSADANGGKSEIVLEYWQSS